MSQNKTSIPIPIFLTQHHFENVLKRRKMVERIFRVFKLNNMI